MMTAADFARALWGLNRILRREKDAYKVFDASNRGFWVSFTAALLVLPLFLFAVFLQYAGLEQKPGGLPFMAANLCFYVIGWTLWPVLLIPVVKFLDRQNRFYSYMVPYNWFRLLEAVVMMPFTVMGALAWLPPGILAPLSLAVGLVLLYYEWTITRSALDVIGPVAVGIVAVDFQISLLISIITARV